MAVAISQVGQMTKIVVAVVGNMARLIGNLGAVPCGVVLIAQPAPVAIDSFDKPVGCVVFEACMTVGINSTDEITMCVIGKGGSGTIRIALFGDVAFVIIGIGHTFAAPVYRHMQIP